MTPKSNSISDQLRAAIESSHLSQNQLAAVAEISPGQLSRFGSGERDLTLSTAGRLCKALGLQLQPAIAAPAPKAKNPRSQPDIPSIMRIVDPAADRGALVTFRDIRPHAKLSKPKFDALVLSLARQQKLVLHRHDYPAACSADDRAALVHDAESDQHYIGAAFRQSRQTK